MKKKNVIILISIIIGIVLLIAIPVVAETFKGIPVKPLKRRVESQQPTIENGTVIGGEVVEGKDFSASDETINALLEKKQSIEEEGSVKKAEEIIRSYSTERFDYFSKEIQDLTNQVIGDEVGNSPIMKEYIDFVIEVYENKQMTNNEKALMQEYLETAKDNFKRNDNITRKIENALETN